jgi:F0F1-type ATP synthase assembly protein I
VFPLVCEKCHAELQVPNSLAGCLIRCHECDTVTRAPHPEVEDEASKAPYVVQTSQETTQHASEIDAFVKDAEKRAEEEANRKPYHKKQFPVDLVCGIILGGGGLILMLRTLLGGAEMGLLGTLIFGILFPLMLILLGAMCLKSWMM